MSADAPLAPRVIPNVSMAGRPAPGPAASDLAGVRQVLTEQMRRVDEQSRLIEEQRRQLEDQRRQLEAQRRQLEALERLLASPKTDSLPDLRAAGTPSSPPPAASPSGGTEQDIAQAGQPAADGAEPSGGEAGAAADGAGTDSEDSRLADVLAEVGRVLTRRGTLIVEPQFQFSHNTASQFFYNGVEIIPGIQIGLIEISENERNTFTNSLGLRYGITNRFEADFKIPFVINQQDSLTRVLSATPVTESTRSVGNSGLGDIEFGGHYQINRGLAGWPFFVGNVRVKTRTGEGPFDIDQDSEAVTGSGFWAVEPSLTVIYPTDPAVVFANVGYTFTFSRNVNSRQRDTLFTTVDPGDVLRTSFGVGIGLNERLSMNLGYKHDWVKGSKISLKSADDPSGPTGTQKTDDFQVGSLQFGLSYKVTETIPVILSVSAGVTSQAPDAEVGIRVPIPINLFD